MADRTISYVFKGTFTNLTAGLAASGKSVAALGEELTALDAKGAKARQALGNLGKVGGGAALLAAGGLAAIVKTTADFDKAMSIVQADTHETAANMELLRAAAIKAGAATVFSAGEAADGIDAMAKAGVSTTDILNGGLTGALSLAAAGGVSVGDAAETAASALTQFGLSGKDIPHVADLLAAGAGKAQGSVSDLSYALKYAGVPAHSLGVSIEETTGVLAEFASAGIVGEQAGTTLRSLLQSLAAPTTKASVTMAEYGINLYNAQGKFVGMQGAAEQLHAKLGVLEDGQRNAALATIFGTNAMQGAIQLYNGGGAAVADWTAKVNDTGYAAKTAAARMNNLSGDIENLKGSLQTAFIGAGDSSQAPLRQLVQDLTKVVNAFNGLPPAAQSSVTSLLSITAVTGSALWLGSKTVGKISSFKQNLDALSESSSKASRAMAGLAKAGLALAALDAAGHVIDGVREAAAQAGPAVADLTASLLSKDVTQINTQFGALGKNIDNLDPGTIDTVANAITNLGAKGGAVGTALTTGLATMTGFGTTLDNAAIKTKSLTQYFGSLDQAFTQLVAAGGVKRAQQAFADLANAQGLNADQQAKLLSVLPQYQTAVKNAANEATLSAEGSHNAAVAEDEHAKATAASAQASRDQAAALADAVDAMKKERDAALAAFDAETQYGQALMDARKQAATAARGLDENTKAGQANRQALSGLAGAWNNQSDAVKNNVKRYGEARSQFLAVAHDMQVPHKAAVALANALLDIPKSTVAKVTTAGVPQAMSAVAALKSLLDSLHDRNIHVNVTKSTNASIAEAVANNADGGFIRGPGGPRDDRIPAMLSNGEFVINAAATARNLPLLHSINAQKFATGGLATHATRHTSVSGGGDLVDYTTWADAMAQFEFHSKNAGRAIEHELTVRSKLLSKELERDKKETDAQKQRLDNLKQERQQLIDAVAGRFAPSLGNVQTPDSLLPTINVQSAPADGAIAETAERSQIMGRLRARGVPVRLLIALGSASIDELRTLDKYGDAQLTAYEQKYAANVAGASPLGGLQKQLADAKTFLALLQQLKAEGLTGAALADAAKSGSLAQLQALSGLGTSGLKDYASTFNQTAAISQQAGVLVGNDSFSSLIAAQAKLYQAALVEQRATNQQLKLVTGELDAVKKHLSEIEKAAKKNAHDTSTPIVAAIKGTVSNGQRRK